jgi:parallel beta-helix repeat protein
VGRDDIIIDGNGYTLQGSGSGTGIGTMFWGIENLTVRNLCIENFDIGIEVGYQYPYPYYDSQIQTHYNISGNDIENNDYGIQIYYCSGININTNNITNNSYGMSIESSVNNTISANYISANNEIGIRLYSCSNNNITTNNLTENSISGILLAYSNDTSISGNTFINNGLFVWNSIHNSVEDNIVNGKPLVYLEDVSNYSVGEAGQVVLVNCDNIRVENLNLSKATTGVELCWTNNSTIISNNLTANGWWGIYLYSSSNNSIIGNVVSDNLRGIWIDWASNFNTIAGNNITGNVQSALFIINDSRYNKVYLNNFNFADSETQQVLAWDQPNFFDDGSHGNYWSNYQTKYPNATQIDGVWDTPYSVYTNNTDHYPLVNQFTGQIPEFPSMTILLLFVLSTVIIIIFKKHIHHR